MIRAARQVQHELVCKERDRGIAELQKSVPFEDAGAPERHRQRHAHHKPDEERLCDRLNQATGIVSQQSDRPEPFASPGLLINDHHASPRVTPVNAPASIMPAIPAAMSKAGEASSADAEASARHPPESGQFTNTAPPGGRCRTTTSRSGLVIKASSGLAASIRPTALMLRFRAQTLAL